MTLNKIGKTTEEIQDIVGSLIDGSNDVNVTYDDVNNKLSVDVSTIDPSKIGELRGDILELTRDNDRLRFDLGLTQLGFDNGQFATYVNNSKIATTDKLETTFGAGDTGRIGINTIFNEDSTQANGSSLSYSFDSAFDIQQSFLQFTGQPVTTKNDSVEYTSSGTKSINIGGTLEPENQEVTFKPGNTGATTTSSGTTGYSNYVTCDVDGDGNDEVVFRSSASDAQIYYYDYEDDLVTQFSNPLNGSPIIAGDFDDDGRDELAYQYDDGGNQNNLKVWDFESGSLVLDSTIGVDGEIGTSGDFDNDGIVEFAYVATSDSNIHVYDLVDGNDDSIDNVTGNAADWNDSSIDSGDVDNDGIPEIVYNSGELAVFDYNDQSYTEKSTTIHGTPVVGDINDDGVDEIVFETTSDAIAYYDFVDDSITTTNETMYGPYKSVVVNSYTDSHNKLLFNDGNTNLKVYDFVNSTTETIYNDVGNSFVSSDLDGDGYDEFAYRDDGNGSNVTVYDKTNFEGTLDIDIGNDGIVDKTISAVGSNTEPLPSLSQSTSELSLTATSGSVRTVTISFTERDETVDPSITITSDAGTQTINYNGTISEGNKIDLSSQVDETKIDDGLIDVLKKTMNNGETFTYDTDDTATEVEVVVTGVSESNVRDITINDGLNPVTIDGNEEPTGPSNNNPTIEYPEKVETSVLSTTERDFDGPFFGDLDGDGHDEAFFRNDERDSDGDTLLRYYDFQDNSAFSTGEYIRGNMGRAGKLEGNGREQITFLDAKSTDDESLKYWDETNGTTDTGVTNVVQSRVADVNDDGLDEIVFERLDGTIDIYNPSNSSIKTTGITAELGKNYQPVAGDFYNNSNPYTLILNSNNEIIRYDYSADTTTNLGIYANSLDAGDFDGDGTPEIVVGNDGQGDNDTGVFIHDLEDGTKTQISSHSIKGPDEVKTFAASPDRVAYKDNDVDEILLYDPNTGNEITVFSTKVAALDTGDVTDAALGSIVTNDSSNNYYIKSINVFSNSNDSADIDIGDTGTTDHTISAGSSVEIQIGTGATDIDATVPTGNLNLNITENYVTENPSVEFDSSAGTETVSYSGKLTDGTTASIGGDATPSNIGNGTVTVTTSLVPFANSKEKVNVDHRISTDTLTSPPNRNVSLDVNVSDGYSGPTGEVNLELLAGPNNGSVKHQTKDLGFVPVEVTLNDDVVGDNSAVSYTIKDGNGNTVTVNRSDVDTIIDCSNFTSSTITVTAIISDLQTELLEWGAYFN